eukprot:gnl/TRDRNA2_/TRDRNA2_168696_c0_seq1.p1 gnl/TRDRNA2_/TRDRNA2_168696_c0~~gnl/TRDRNA2_/TRDRNA2_168696_c0_seq1.p1  ORF type:complete len:179 (-),score=34.40 gnl/TRDRNA2_/TRDRNA2_168696_c0_seq1:115-651(-)
MPSYEKDFHVLLQTLKDGKARSLAQVFDHNTKVSNEQARAVIQVDDSEGYRPSPSQQPPPAQMQEPQKAAEANKQLNVQEKPAPATLQDSELLQLILKHQDERQEKFLQRHEQAYERFLSTLGQAIAKLETLTMLPYPVGASSKGSSPPEPGTALSREEIRASSGQVIAPCWRSVNTR